MMKKMEEMSEQYRERGAEKTLLRFVLVDDSFCE